MSQSKPVLRSMFNEAVEITDPTARAAFLDGACKGDSDLRSRVERLLAAESRAGNFLRERPGPARSVPSAAKFGSRMPHNRLPESIGDGSYELLEEIARGGMGIVYKARQTRLNRIVALKAIAAGRFASPDFVERFRVEAETVARLDHPNIVPIYEVGEWEGQPFFSMKFAEGGSLSQRISNLKSGLSSREAAELLVKLARAVHYAHQRGILHRDIKPGNVLLDAQGEPHLTDFGLAKLVEKDSTLTHTMAMLGTPSYMSPEQARGDAKQLTTAVDVYGLGAIFYELLTGRPPFAGGTTMETVRQVLDKEPPWPSSVKPGIDRDLETISLKCLAKEPSRRYESAEALAADLERWLRHEPILARPVAGLERVAKWVRRRPLAAALSAVTLLAVAASVAILIRANINIRAAQSREVKLRQVAELQEKIARQRAYSSDINLAQQALAENNLGRARELVGRQRPDAAGGPDLRGWEWRYLWQQCRSDALFSLARDQGSIYALAVSPDARWLAVGGVTGARLALWDFTARREVKLLADGVRSVRAAFSPTEPLLAYAASLSKSNQPTYRLRLWNTDTQAKAGEWLLPGNCAGLAFSQDGHTLLTAIDEPAPQLMLWDLQNKTLRSRIPNVAMRKTIGTPFAASRDLHWVASATADDQIRVMDMVAGRVAWEGGQLAGATINSLAIDGTQAILAAGYHTSDPFIQLYHLATGEELARLPIHHGYVICMEFSADGQTLITAGSDQSITQWDIATRRPLATLRGHSFEVWRLALLPDGKTLVSGSGDGEILAWDLRAGGVKGFVTLPVAPSLSWRFAPTSDSIITCDLDGEVVRWEGRDFQERQPLLKLGGGLVNVAFSEDCGALAASFTNGIIRVWNLNQESPWRELKTGSSSAVVWGLAAGTNRLLVVHENDQSLHAWDLISGVEQRPGPDLKDWRVRGSFPHGSRERFTGPALKRYLDAAPAPQRLPDRVSRVFAGAFSQDHHYFARARPLSLVEVEDVESGRTLGQLRGILQGVHSLAFSPDSRRLAVGSDDRQAVKLWDLQSFQELVTLPGSSSAYTQTRFSPDGNLLGTMNARGVLHVWRAPSWQEIEAEEGAVESLNR